MPRDLKTLVALYQSDPGALTPAELTFVRRELKSYQSRQGEQGYEKERTQAVTRRRKDIRDSQDIGPCPPCADPVRREAARLNLQVFLRTYFARAFPRPWAPDQLKAIGKLERAILHGGRFNFAMPRGSGKTTIVERCAIWALLYGYCHMVQIVAATADLAYDTIDSIRGELADNDLLLGDFPEACYPIHCLEGQNKRCLGQHSEGVQTKIKWSPTLIRLPYIKDSTGATSLAAEGIVRAVGITGAIRGPKFKRHDGKIARPDLVLLDDVQTRESAGSAIQTETRERIILGDVLGLAGKGKPIACAMTCTVIYQDDLSSRFLNRDRHPEWQGERSRLVYQFPDRMDLWEEYAEIRRASYRNDGTGEEANEFHAEHQAEMDAGALVPWPEFKNDCDLTPLQTAMNLWIDDAESFAAEQQNDPVESLGESDQLSPDEIANRINTLAYGIVPLSATKLTAFIDVQHTLLYWLVAAWQEDFTGAVIAYGTWPDQRLPYFELKQARNTLPRQFPGQSLQAVVTQGLAKLTEELLGRSWSNEAGTSLRIERCPVDAKEGMLTETIAEFCRRSPFAGILTPSMGKGMSPADKPMSEWQPKPGRKVGTHWIHEPWTKHAVRGLLIDVNFWKTFTRDRLLTPLGNSGALSIFGRDRSAHRMLCDHLCSEYSERLKHEKAGRIVDVWKLKPGSAENHWWDCAVGATAAASLQGCKLPTMQGTQQRLPPKQRPTLAQLANRSRA